MSSFPERSDSLATVVDWLDACRNRRVDVLLDLYDEAATLQCACDGDQTLTGYAALDAYWRPKLIGSLPGAFSLEDLTVGVDDVVVDCRNYAAKPVRIHFSFNGAGKIQHTRCAPLGACTG